MLCEDNAIVAPQVEIIRIFELSPRQHEPTSKPVRRPFGGQFDQFGQYGQCVPFSHYTPSLVTSEQLPRLNQGREHDCWLLRFHPLPGSLGIGCTSIDVRFDTCVPGSLVVSNKATLHVIHHHFIVECPRPDQFMLPAYEQQRAAAGEEEKQQARLEEVALDLPSSCWRDLRRIDISTPKAKRAILNRHKTGDWTRDFYQSRSNCHQVETYLREHSGSLTVTIVGRSKQGKSALINSLFTAKDLGRPYHKVAPVGENKSLVTTRGRVSYTLCFDNSELELVDTRGFTLPDHWRSELLRLVRGQSLPLRKGDEWRSGWIQVRNDLQDKPRRARVALLVLRGNKAGSDHFDQYRKMGETLDGVVPYLYVITYARLPADLDVARLAKNQAG